MASIKQLVGLCTAMLLAFVSGAAFAQNVRIQNAWKSDQQINVEASETPVSSPTPAAFLSSQWVIEPVSGTPFVRIKNVWRGTYLNVEGGKLQSSAIEPGWNSAMWRLVATTVPGTYRIENAWSKGALNIENGSLVASDAAEGWQSAAWALLGYTPGAPAAPAPAAPAPVAPASSYSAPSAIVADAPLTAAAVTSAEPSYKSQDWRSAEFPSYHDSDIPFTYDSTVTSENKWVWNKYPGTEMTLYNPLDGGAVLRFRVSDKLGNSDSCSAGSPPYTTYFQNACLTHDWHYDAPFAKAGFPNFPGNARSIGKDIVDFMFHTDMLRLAKVQNVVSTGPDIMYGSVLNLSLSFRGADKDVVAKGGVVAVSNNGGYVSRLKVSWVDPSGIARSTEMDGTAGSPPATIPLSVGSTNIKIVVSSVGGQEIFSKSFANVGMYTYSVGGVINHESYEEGLTTPINEQVRDAFSSGGVVHTFFTKTLVYGFTGNSQEYTADIDNCHSGLEYTDTQDTITLYLYDENGSNFIQNSVKGSGSCSTSISIETDKKVTRFALGTNGQDAMYIDEVKFSTGKSWFAGGTVISDSGRNDGGGWCLSNDPNDDADWRSYLSGKCQAILQFPE